MKTRPEEKERRPKHTARQQSQKAPRFGLSDHEPPKPKLPTRLEVVALALKVVGELVLLVRHCL
jgi:hypothetical protein